jgi:hypothetical protein
MKNPELIDQLTERLATDAEFREMFTKTPGKASNAMGIPYEDFQEMLAQARASDEIALADRDSAATMTLYGRFMSAVKGALGADNTCACDYTPGTYADYCVQ